MFLRTDKTNPRISEFVEERSDEETDPYNYYNKYVYSMHQFTLFIYFYKLELQGALRPSF